MSMNLESACAQSAIMRKILKIMVYVQRLLMIARSMNKGIRSPFRSQCSPQMICGSEKYAGSAVMETTKTLTMSEGEVIVKLVL
jgi:hypothetical protein